MATYYVENLFYTELSDLLSDGWAEDKMVRTDTGAITSIAQLRKQFRDPAVYASGKPRMVAVANESYAERVPSGAVQYAVAIITEDEPGWFAGGWYSELHEAQETARSYNRAAGHTQESVLDVQVSSMRASRTR